MALGISTGLFLTAVSCEPKEQTSTVEAPMAVKVEGVEGGLQLYTDPFVNSESAKSSVMEAGARAVAVCFQPNKVEDFSSVYVKNSTAEGFTTILAFEGSKDETPTPIFDKNIDELSKLPNC